MSGGASDHLLLTVPPKLVEEIAQRAAALVAEHQPQGEDGWLRGAARIAAYIDAPVSRVYALASCKPQRIPVERDGAALIARRSVLDAWVRSGGGSRP
jgi:hypothetical protein